MPGQRGAQEGWLGVGEGVKGSHQGLYAEAEEVTVGSCELLCVSVPCSGPDWGSTSLQNQSHGLNSGRRGIAQHFTNSHLWEMTQSALLGPSLTSVWWSL